jgi:hypothetical protein
MLLSAALSRGHMSGDTPQMLRCAPSGDAELKQWTLNQYGQPHSTRLGSY